MPHRNPWDRSTPPDPCAFQDLFQNARIYYLYKEIEQKETYEIDSFNHVISS